MVGECSYFGGCPDDEPTLPMEPTDDDQIAAMEEHERPV